MVAFLKLAEPVSINRFLNRVVGGILVPPEEGKFETIKSMSPSLS